MTIHISHKIVNIKQIINVLYGSLVKQVKING